MNQTSVAIITPTVERLDILHQTYPLTVIESASELNKLPEADIVIWLDNHHFFSYNTVVEEIVAKFEDVKFAANLIYSDYVDENGLYHYNAPFARGQTTVLNQAFAFHTKTNLTQMPLDSYEAASKFILTDKLAIHIAKPLFTKHA